MTNLSVIPKTVAIIAKRNSMILEKLGSLTINKIATKTKNATMFTFISLVASEKIVL